MNATSSAVTGSPSCQTRVVAQLEGPDVAGRVDRPALGEVGHERPGRAVADEPREDQRDEVAIGLGPRRQRADRDRVSEDAFAIRPSREASTAGLWLGWAVVVAAGLSAGTPTRPARSASSTTSVPTTSESVRVIELRRMVFRRGGPPRSPDQAGGGGGEDEGGQGEDDEQDEQDDRELPEPALDAAPAAVDGGIATERAGQADTARLQQDRDDERDAHDDLADGQKGIHEF